MTAAEDSQRATPNLAPSDGAASDIASPAGPNVGALAAAQATGPGESDGLGPVARVAEAQVALEPDAAAPVGQFDVDDLRSRLGDLLSAYRTSLRFVEQLPFASRHPVRSRDMRWYSQRKRVIVRPLLRVFVEAHIRRQIVHLTRVLRIEALSVHPPGPRQKSLQEIVKGLIEDEAMLFGWTRLRIAWSKAPFLPAAVAFAVSVYGVATGLDLSSPAQFGRTAAESAQTIGWRGVAEALSMFALFAIVVYTILLSPAALHGFKRKRALFLGGAIDHGDEVFPYPFFWLRRKGTDWVGLPRMNVYRAENDLFALLGVRKQYELAIDMFLAPAPYLMLWSFALLAARTLREREPDWTSLVGFLVIIALAFVSRIAVLRDRRTRVQR